VPDKEGGLRIASPREKKKASPYLGKGGGGLLRGLQRIRNKGAGSARAKGGKKETPSNAINGE